MVQRILINKAGRCWECRAEIEDKSISSKPKYCGDECRQVVEQRVAARHRRGQCGFRRDETRDELSRTQEALLLAQEELDWRRREQNRPADTGEVRWMTAELVKLPGVGGTGEYDTPEGIVARVRGALTEANNRAMAWARRAKGASRGK